MPKRMPDGMTTRPGRSGYYADFVHGGRRVQRKLSDDFDAAKKMLHKLRADLDKGDFGLLADDYPLDRLTAAYLRRCDQERRPGTSVLYRRALAAVLGWLGVTRVRQIDPDRVRAYRQERLGQGISPRTINLDVGVVKSMLGWGVKQKLIGSNPLAELARLPHDNPKEGRALSDAEVARLLEKSPPPWRDMWYAYLVTGLRKSDLAGLTFRDVDAAARELVIRPAPGRKGRRERRIPIEDGLWAIIERQRAAAARCTPGVGSTPAITARVRERFTREHVFVTTQNTPLTRVSCLYPAFMRCCRLAGIETRTVDAGGREVEHVDLHSLRRTFTTNVIVNGADPKTVQELLGHSTLDMTLRVYTKVKAGNKRQAIGRLSYAAGVTAPDHLLPLRAAGQ
jgi:integrase